MTDILQQTSQIAARRECDHADAAELYRTALEEGDLDMLITLYELAERDQLLTQTIEKIDQQVQAEIPPEDLRAARDLVQNILRKHERGEL